MSSALVKEGSRTHEEGYLAMYRKDKAWMRLRGMCRAAESVEEVGGRFVVGAQVVEKVRGYSLHCKNDIYNRIGRTFSSRAGLSSVWRAGGPPS